MFLLMASCGIALLVQTQHQMGTMLKSPLAGAARLQQQFYQFQDAFERYLAGPGEAALQSSIEAYDRFDGSYHSLIVDWREQGIGRKPIYKSLERQFNAIERVEEKLETFAPAGLSAEAEKELEEELNRIDVALAEIEQVAARRAAVSSPPALVFGQQAEIYVYAAMAVFGLLGTGAIGTLLFIRRGMNDVESQARSRQMLATRYQHAIEIAADGIAVLGPDMMIDWANTEFCRLLGLRVITPGETSFIQCFQSAESDPGRIEREAGQYLEKYGRWQYVLHLETSAYAELVLDISLASCAGGEIICVARDMTRQEKAERMLEQRLAAIEAAGDGIGIVDAQGHLTYMNEALRRLHGIHPQDKPLYIGRDWTELYTDKGRHYIRQEVLPQLMRERSWRGESPILRKDGEVIQAELALTMLEDGGMIGTARDTTLRRRAEEEKRVLQQQIFQAQKMEAVGRLAGGIAHDFNNILAAMLGYAEFLNQDLPEESPHREFAGNITQAGLQARRLVDQILAFSRKELESPETVDLTQVLNETLGMLKSSLPTTIIIDAHVGLSQAYMEGNPSQISQMLMNIFVNAKDAIGSRHGRLDIRLEELSHGQDWLSDMTGEDPAGDQPPIRLESPDTSRTRLLFGRIHMNAAYARIHIRDTGCGMNRVVVEHMLEPFFTTKPVEKGTGLGMATVHGVLTAHKGAMIIDTTEGEGTSFELFLPLTLSPAKVSADMQAQLGPVTGSGHIVVAEDQDYVRHMVEHMLGRLGYSVAAFAGAQDALSYITSYEDDVDLVLSDQTMPGMTGLELAQKIDSGFPDIPVVLISGYNRDRLVEAIAGCPAIRAVLRKPVDSTTLSRTLHTILTDPKGPGQVTGTGVDVPLEDELPEIDDIGS